MNIIARWCIILFAAASLAGCARDTGSVLTGLNPATPAYAGDLRSNLSQDPTKKTLVSKMLTAIALERVTGRKPDPSRLSEL